jgi:hypothetical protein
VLECQGQEKILFLEKRLGEINNARNDIISLIASGGCDEEKMDSEFAKLYAEEQTINEQLSELKGKIKLSTDTKNKIDSAMNMIENEKFKLDFFDNIIISKLIECIKVLNKTEILIIFKGGVEVKAEIE